MASSAAAGGLRRGTGQAARTMRSLVAITLLGVVLAIYNAVTLHRDVGLAIGPAGKAQEQFFINAADRPDIATFFKNLIPVRRLIMARNIGRYTDPELAQLCGKCLDTFDPGARAALTTALSGVAKLHPQAVAALMKLPGSFQQLSVATALRSAGPGALPLVAKQFSDGDARPNAIAFLVASGPVAIGPTLPYLSNSNKDIRLAAADTLGKLRAREAVPELTSLFNKSQGEERLEYLTALAGIGDPSTEPMMTENLRNVAIPTPSRGQAALGLGAIGSPTSLTTLWSYATDADMDLRENVRSALAIAGDGALQLGLRLCRTPDSRIALQRVAGAVHSKLSDSIISQGLLAPETSAVAADVSGLRPELAPALVAQVHRLDAATQGDRVDSILRALASTPEGHTLLQKMAATHPDSPLAALAARRLGTL